MVIDDPPPTLWIDADALRGNAQFLRGRLASGATLCAMVKADAYGLGAADVVPVLQGLVDRFAVATVDEAAELPAGATPVLVLRPLTGVGEAEREGIRRGWTFTIAEASALDDLARAADRAAARVDLNIMLDTGLTRCGIAAARLASLVEAVARRPGLRLAMVGTHFACAESVDDPFTSQQLTRFLEVAEPLRRGHPDRPRLHAANTAAVLLHPAAHLDMVRPGIGLYGIDPGGTPQVDHPLRPAARWTAPLLAIHEVEPGAAVGYGRTWTSARRGRIGVVPVGYADGYPRAASNAAAMLVGGAVCPVAGRVSMDMTTIDLTHAPAARPGDQVTVLDADPLSPAGPYALARAAGTIAYELLARVGRRVRRRVASAGAGQRRDAA